MDWTKSCLRSNRRAGLRVLKFVWVFDTGTTKIGSGVKNCVLGIIRTHAW